MKRASLILSVLLPILISSVIAGAQAPSDTAQGFAGINIGAGLAVGLAAIGAGIAVGMAAAAGVGVLTERRDMFGTVLIFVAIGEGIAVYGILFAVLMLFGKF
ncbi:MULTISPECIES: ATP synthase subunit c family protein [Saccharolobus]|uniref:V-type ATP synthase subunit K n=7 Tax=Saccharolobus TaxID=2100760 RepID=A0A8F5GXK8_9CREN|nr:MULTISPECIES: ATP synthase subunit K [Sulfolobaceae]ACP55556.1 H+transporting two-sector ATPase C subunit [Sulfolobus islandicus M.16.27]ACR42160.1 H+transporting two-sector ATPase C subunit [Sulfolobus islandicus M.16.4]ADX82876.1 H+transporting two-sector ATPase C subunit [Sulfolobus islandicus HVE10/4]ADX85503.1 H+transporting two-sector ATPase C subunit [Sulfolobus islandicus REY15A]AGJ62887.1 F0F1-type ATP synthase, subunit c/Archaeal/vacuolar-type H+-ATPase, subunit K [Sulfolobus isla